MENQIKFLRGLLANYNNVSPKDANTFYVVGDAQDTYNKIYLGSNLIGSTLADDIVLTGYQATSTAEIAASDSVLEAIQKLDTKLGAVADNAGVTSIGGKAGAFTFEAASQDNGKINLSVDDNNVISAAIVGLGSAAYKNIDYFATAAQGDKADTAVQTITGDTFHVFTKTGTDETLAVTYGNYSGTDGVAKTSDTKTYVDDTISAAINDLDSTAGIAYSANGVVTLKRGLTQTDGKIGNDTSDNITLSKVATTGEAVDVSFSTTQEGFTTTTTVDAALKELISRHLSLKDLVVESGQLVVNPAGQPDGTYIELTLNDEAETKIYINVQDLIDIYTGTAVAANTEGGVSVSVSPENEISADLVDGSVSTAKIIDSNVTTAKIADSNVTTAKIADSNVTTAKIADSNVTTAKIADSNVTFAKLADDVTTSLVWGTI